MNGWWSKLYWSFCMVLNLVQNLAKGLHIFELGHTEFERNLQCHAYCQSLKWKRKTVPCKSNAVKSNAVISIYLPPVVIVRHGLSVNSSSYVCSEKYLPFHLQLVLAGTLHILESTQFHQQLVDGSNPSCRVQGLYTRSVLHGHATRSNTLPPICPRPSTSVILHFASGWLMSLFIELHNVVSNITVILKGNNTEIEDLIIFLLMIQLCEHSLPCPTMTNYQITCTDPRCIL